MQDVLGTSTASNGSKLLGSWNQGWNKAFITCMDPTDARKAIAHTHVDDFLIVFRKASKAHNNALKHLPHARHLKQQTGTIHFHE